MTTAATQPGHTPSPSGLGRPAHPLSRTIRRCTKRLQGVIASALALSALAGCTLIAPARFDRVPARDLFSDSSPDNGTPEMPLTGQYNATFLTPWTGPLTGRLYAEPTKDGFIANTKPDVAWSLVGGIEGSLGPILAPFIFPRGMILTWRSTMPTDEEQGVGSIGFGSRSSMRLDTRIRMPGAPVEILMRDGRVLGTLSLRRASAEDASPIDHAALVRRTREIVLEHPITPERTTATLTAIDALSRATEKVQDDLEFLMVQALAARQSPKATAPLLYPRPRRSGDNHVEPGHEFIYDWVTPYAVRHNTRSGITTIKFEAILDETMVDAAFTQALDLKPRAIILDLRQAAGLDVGSLRALSWIAPTRVHAGTFTSEDSLENGPNPMRGESAAPARATLDTPADYAALRELLKAGNAVDVETVPVASGFTGPVAVLLSSPTSSYAEALASAIRTLAVAPTFGEPTAGRPWVAAEFDVGQGWVARIPVAQFVPLDGESMQDKGVEPLMPTTGRTTMAEALKWIHSRFEVHTWDAPAWNMPPETATGVAPSILDGPSFESLSQPSSNP